MASSISVDQEGVMTIHRFPIARFLGSSAERMVSRESATKSGTVLKLFHHSRTRSTRTAFGMAQYCPVV